MPAKLKIQSGQEVTRLQFQMPIALRFDLASHRILARWTIRPSACPPTLPYSTLELYKLHLTASNEPKCILEQVLFRQQLVLLACHLSGTTSLDSLQPLIHTLLHAVSCNNVTATHYPSKWPLGLGPVAGIAMNSRFYLFLYQASKG